ncbi:hypothetical protein CCR79_08265 [Halorhodospira halophila]|nr:hypothetical protein [Halorhodospira halophila]
MRQDHDIQIKPGLPGRCRLQDAGVRALLVGAGVQPQEAAGLVILVRDEADRARLRASPQLFVWPPGPGQDRGIGTGLLDSDGMAQVGGQESVLTHRLRQQVVPMCLHAP